MPKLNEEKGIITSVPSSFSSLCLWQLMIKEKSEAPPKMKEIKVFVSL